MVLIVVDTGPINFLIHIGCVDVLERLRATSMFISCELLAQALKRGSNRHAN